MVIKVGRTGVVTDKVATEPDHPQATDPDDVYGGYVDWLLTTELARKSSLQQRGVGVVTGATAIATLVFGFVTGVLRPSGAHLSTLTRVLASVDIGLLTLAAVFGSAANIAGGRRGEPEPELAAHYGVAPDPGSRFDGARPADDVKRAKVWMIRSKLVRFNRTQKHNAERALSINCALIFEGLAIATLVALVATGSA